MSNEMFWSVVLVVGASALILLYYSIPHMKKWVVWGEIRPYVVAAIMEAYRASDKAVEYGMERLDGFEKKEIADWLYNYIPETIKLGPITIMTHRVITREQWAGLVQAAFDELEKLLASAREDMNGEFTDWLGTV